jgi:hypothetical protein
VTYKARLQHLDASVGNNEPQAIEIEAVEEDTSNFPEIRNMLEPSYMAEISVSINTPQLPEDTEIDVIQPTENIGIPRQEPTPTDTTDINGSAPHADQTDNWTVNIIDNTLDDIPNDNTSQDGYKELYAYFASILREVRTKRS